jgi:AcrR family transcriptional regulator
MAARRTPLSHDRVLRAALDLVDREGVAGLTMRRLGRELGVEAMSLYGYVDSKEDLIDGVVEQVFRQMPLIVPGPGRWQDRLYCHAASTATCADHPVTRAAPGGR